MTLTERIASTLTPHMGYATANAVAVHVCAKFEVPQDASLTGEDRTRLSEFLRRGLVVYVGADKAAELAAACVAEPAGE